MLHKSRALFTHLLLGSMIFSTAIGMDNDKNEKLNNNPPITNQNSSSSFTTGLSWLFGNGNNTQTNQSNQTNINQQQNNNNNSSHNFSWFGLNNQTVQAMVNETVHAIIYSLTHQENAQALVTAFGTLFNSSAQVIQQQFGQGGNSSQAMRAFLDAIAQNLGSLWRKIKDLVDKH